MTEQPVRIAFVCVQNAGRSQMAAAFAREQIETQGIGDRIKVVSGGTDPADHVHEVVVEAMAETGHDISTNEPRLIGHEEITTVDYVVTMGCSADDVCPATWRGDSRDWDLADPAGTELDVVRDVRDDIEERVGELLEEILDLRA